jgi:para-aminobenzoate synthetase component 1
MATVARSQWIPGCDQARFGLSRAPACAILESTGDFGELSRFSLYAAAPRAVFQVFDQQWRLSDDWPGPSPHPDLGPFDALRQLLAQTRTIVGSELPFAGGWIGYLGYDLAPRIESLPRRFPRPGSLPDLHLAYYDTFAVHDHATGEVRTVAVDRFREGAAATARRRREFEELLYGEPPDDRGDPLVAGPPQSNFTPDEYCCAIERILEYLRAGDIFQANFAHQFSAPFVGSVEHLYSRSVAHCPAPFGGLIRGDDWAIVSTSPERFFLCEPDGRIETRPIKGTRSRGRDAIHDLWLRSELAASPKDRAELTMIVDLERNDLGRVCRFGSVRVSRHAVVESFANVHHLVSTVEGRLRPGCDVVDLIRAMFPGGSITGAPKIRAMEIIDELERGRRGVYTGAIGYLSDHGRADFNIAIRTVVIDGPLAHFHVGGGIVIDSDPLAEYRETLAKGRRIRDVLLGEI